MEIVIENPSDASMPTSNSGFKSLPGQYYGTLPFRKRPHIITQPDFDVTTPVRRVDKSGLLEIAEPEIPRCRLQPQHLIDRMCLLEAVPEVPDQLQGQSPELNTLTRSTENSRVARSIVERHLTGAEIDKRDQQNRGTTTTSPRSSRSMIDKSLSTSALLSSPYFRRGQTSPKSSGKTCSTDTMIDSIESESRSQFSNKSTKFLPIDSLSRNTREPYVDLTGATYTKSRVNSPLVATSMSGESEEERDGRRQQQQQQQQPDCLTKLSPRSRDDKTSSSMPVSSIPDVIEAHESKGRGDGDKEVGRGQRAEAEGCEHTAIESLEETRVSFKASNKLLHNDNIQTLRVIILSEQL
jgi:hypothetical protein